MVEITNLREGCTKRHAAFIIPSVLGALSLAGVAVRPSVDVRHAELDLALAEKRVHERQQSARELARFERDGGLERTRAGLVALRDLVPAPMPELELHGLLRLIALKNHIELAALEIGAPYDPGLERLDDVAALREVRIEGASSTPALFGALAMVKELGRAVSVLECQISNSEEPGRQHWTLVLGVFESYPVDDFSALAQAEVQEGSP